MLIYKAIVCQELHNLQALAIGIWYLRLVGEKVNKTFLDGMHFLARS